MLAAPLACAPLLGGWNRMVVLPALHMRAEQHDPGCPAAQRHFDAVLCAEAAVMFAALVLAAVLGQTAPTAGSP
ncbi:TPA: hypothetical protein QDC20_005870 [Burkholderia aenigmatica]|uniref:hypothetical protein n=1 Tax=Burkholderia sp. AU45251 TaxID=3059204 RepID=UPI0026520A30|nr:hypothetical protein [Burkholderia sp. AU45251]HDR9483921.1 hypothetical protein [Burkholderia aenigmatica]MDN7516180.1 hypothetical protein [Burkholderia sp. AU45251]HDR9514886.1 hypothetical protein [Burkholderia aenigmatica]HDR9591971.1 hypothetical protein [Burkholderia aenigmatica]HDR9601253.1 hypothetical protein [Burkholderia aenigmatica]